MDRFEEMRSFLAVVDAGSFVGAADATAQSKAMPPSSLVLIFMVAPL